jgi:enamine deaminase RidA (YjgF/YER057c/UK114 family)
MIDTSTLPLSWARKSGSLVFLSGQLALKDGAVVGDDIATQTNLAIDAIEMQLAPFGLGLGDVVKTTVWLVSKADFPAFNAAYGARFSAPFPVRATVVSELIPDRALVEIEAIAQARE